MTKNQNPIKEIIRALKIIIEHGINRAIKKNNAHRFIYDDFTQAVKSGNKSFSDISWALPVVEAIEKIVSAAENNKPVVA